MVEVVEVVGGVRVVEVVGSDVVDDEGDDVVDVDGLVVVLVVEPVVLHELSTIADSAADTTSAERLEMPGRLADRLMRAPSGDRSCHQRGPSKSQPPETSCKRFWPAAMNGIMARSSAPTFSIWCSDPSRRNCSNFWRPLRFSAIHSSANAPDWMSVRIFRIVSRTSRRSPPVRA